jgi:hypothetical protein
MKRPMRLDTGLVPGDLRLLRDLVAVARLTDTDPVPARTRLDRELGTRFSAEVRRSLTDTMPRAA